ncbi:PP2C family serine/threonine-protein phosphatase [Vibrio tubiashii]|uniref:Protein serine/threonine phosphatase, protein phosphatase 2C-like protein n=1 Tax=Vibrio tubiashii ATCC 19109 TaxID=1051646 RepID=F9T3W3_9VIBR|nr:PP2C family serine/threonine-protein phosphatase [Vibrio tubiashii]AIW17168.1 serine/threonine protein phosphatase [Vibrio tubiashii ATCC 19109]EGU56478.1 protein serine/threonine phosphatase, protein phosphatase 2C-like protein [Vibrio tubiashii ATCC 19109]EIF01331.1 hypothetical protein VT1337_24315 [Vibrio tubiashii NCIMB 1337 = ATCC 19106]
MINLVSSSGFSVSKSVDLENSDAVLMPKKVSDGYLFAVADGVGQTLGAQKASQIAISQLNEIKKIEDKPDFKKYFSQIRKEFIRISKSSNELYNMATTLTVCFVRNNQVWYAHTGDSRLYALYNDDLIQKTIDQTEHEYLVSNGIFSKRQVSKMRRSNVLMSSLSPRVELDINEGNFKLSSTSNSLILMTDGAYKFWEKNPKFSNSTMSDINLFASSLKKRILNTGPVDDFSVVAAEFQEANKAFKSDSQRLAF